MYNATVTDNAYVNVYPRSVRCLLVVVGIYIYTLGDASNSQAEESGPIQFFVFVDYVKQLVRLGSVRVIRRI